MIHARLFREATEFHAEPLMLAVGLGVHPNADPGAFFLALWNARGAADIEPEDFAALLGFLHVGRA